MGSADSLQWLRQDLGFRRAALQRAGVPIPPSWDAALADTEACESALRKTFQAEAITGEAAAFDALGSKALAQVLALNQQLLAELNPRLQLREHRLGRAMAWQLAGNDDLCTLKINAHVQCGMAGAFGLDKSFDERHHLFAPSRSTRFSSV